jgi:hypothetical protein
MGLPDQGVTGSPGSELPPCAKAQELPGPAPMEMDAPDPPPPEGLDHPTSGVLHQLSPP